MAQNETDGADTWLDLPPTARQTRWALGVTAVVLAGFVAVIPVAGQPMVELNAFFPSLDAVVFVSDLVTAVLLYAQFTISARARCWRLRPDICSRPSSSFRMR